MIMAQLAKRQLSDNICICRSCEGASTGKCTYYNNAIKPIFEAASFTAYDFDDNDPLTYKLVDILKKYTCDFYFKKEANSPENLE
jgi:hypothetical protein